MGGRRGEGEGEGESASSPATTLLRLTCLAPPSLDARATLCRARRQPQRGRAPQRPHQKRVHIGELAGAEGQDGDEGEEERG